MSQGSSGSHNVHARKSPSDSKRWVTCTSAIDYERMFMLANRKTRTSGELAELHGLLARFDVSLDEAKSVHYTEHDETIYNVEGTKAHDWAEKVLSGACTLADVPKDLRDPVGTYVFECNRIADESDGMEPFIEYEAPLFYEPNPVPTPVRDKDGKVIRMEMKRPTGTMDFAVVSQDRVRVRDYKHGIGIFVPVEENTQLAIYVYSLMLDLEAEGFYSFGPDTEVEIGVVQPRHRKWEPDKYWVLSYADLKAFCEQEIQPSCDVIDEAIETVFAPSYDACFFCKLKAFCGARLHHLAQGLPLLPNGVTEADFLEGLPTYDERGSEQKFEKAHPLPEDRIAIYTENYGTIPVEQLVKIYANKKGITAFLNDVEKYLTRRGLEGDPAPGTKIVIGREGNSDWTDEEAAEKLLENQGLRKDERCKIEVISPTKAREILGPKVDTKKKNNPYLSPRLVKALDALITRAPGKKKLALANDAREAVESNLEGFDDISDLADTYDEIE